MHESSMKVVEIAQSGGPEALQISERSIPEIKSGEVLIQVAAAGGTSLKVDLYR